MKHFLVMTTDGGDRHDANIYYAGYVMVDDMGHLPSPNTLLVDGSRDLSSEQFISKLTDLGYGVEELKPEIIITDEYSGWDNEDEDDQDENPDDPL